jgi:hypothetical protein
MARQGKAHTDALRAQSDDPSAKALWIGTGGQGLYRSTPRTTACKRFAMRSA